MRHSTVSVQNVPGCSVPILVPNTVKDFKGFMEFYISYNNYDIATYGCDTTALVVGQMEHFFILNGDHREAFNKIVEHTTGTCKLKACIQYFLEHAEQVSKYSELPNKLFGGFHAAKEGRVR